MENTHTLIVGAGPAGLAAAHRLAEAGLQPVILEKADAVGGLMRGIRRGDFRLDLGCKELYSRIEEVDALWSELLDGDYCPYDHRVGVLYDGRILELASQYRGFRRGMPWSAFTACGLDLLWSWIRPAHAPRNYEEYWYRSYGRLFSRIFAQGYREKFRQIAWSDMPAPHDNGEVSGVLGRLTQSLKVGFQDGKGPAVWRHPAGGTGQICERLEASIRSRGGRFLFGANVIGFGAAAGRVVSVETEVGGEARSWRPAHVVVSLPIELLGRLLGDQSPGEVTGSVPAPDDRSTVLVYLFLDEDPRFPHAWLEVTDGRLKAGRITNYAAFGRDMVPPGKTCLCVEFFCRKGDSIFRSDRETLLRAAIEECAGAGLIDPGRLFDHLILRLPGADASTSWRDWSTAHRMELLSALRAYENLYFVNRPGTDRATHAGIHAADAIISGSRETFDAVTDPAVDLNASRRASSADFIKARL